ncbi:MAG TPA: site-2 protease family protein [Candidatus Paceibacterota bacterium]|jgi:Zn-dependent protease
MEPTLLLIIVVILILSVIIHEISHGYAALYLGDPTARLAGRLTLNPLPHIDPLGTIIIPAILVLSSAGFVIGWAKPVPYNPYNLRNQRWGEAMVAGAGPLVNIGIALIFGLLIRFGDVLSIVSIGFYEVASLIVFINILLAIFNLIPVPPLDGSKVLHALLPYHLALRYEALGEFMARYGLITTFAFIFIFIFFLWPLFFHFVSAVFSLITGTTLF